MADFLSQGFISSVNTLEYVSDGIIISEGTVILEDSVQSAFSQVDLQTQLSKLTVSWNHYPRDRREPSSGWFQAIQHQLTEQKEKIDS